LRSKGEDADAAVMTTELKRTTMTHASEALFDRLISRLSFASLAVFLIGLFLYECADTAALGRDRNGRFTLYVISANA
jgi:hypothetical protein